MAIYNLGKIGMNPCGAYSATKQYSNCLLYTSRPFGPGIRCSEPHGGTGLRKKGDFPCVNDE